MIPGMRQNSQKYKFCKDYRENSTLRRSFNQLSGAVFGLEFETWYQNGYWADEYNPYSIEADGAIVANISVNHMEFLSRGVKKQYIQLGTVMTGEEYRHQGMSRFLMERILEEYRESVDGIYLFANEKVLDFYPKFGFTPHKEYQYSKTLQGNRQVTALPYPMDGPDNRERFVEAVENSAVFSSFEMVHNPGLILFYASQFMKDCVYYLKNRDAFLVAETEGEELILYHVFSRQQIELDEAAAAFGPEIKRLRLGFTPLECQGYEAEEHCFDKTVLFTLGVDFHQFDEDQKMFPLLSHA